MELLVTIASEYARETANLIAMGPAIIRPIMLFLHTTKTAQELALLKEIFPQIFSIAVAIAPRRVVIQQTHSILKLHHLLLTPVTPRKEPFSQRTAKQFLFQLQCN
jgi:hypothetical protein